MVSQSLARRSQHIDVTPLLVKRIPGLLSQPHLLPRIEDKIETIQSPGLNDTIFTETFFPIETVPRNSIAILQDS